MKMYLHYVLYFLFSCTHDRTLNLDVTGINVYFYDFPRKEIRLHPIDEAAIEILSYEHLDPVRRFIFFVGGFKSHIDMNPDQTIKDTFKDFPNSYLIMFDHSEYTNDRDGVLNSYDKSVKYVHYIGKAIGNFLSKLKFAGISSKSMHCIGYSLGAQILAHTGDVFLKNTGEKIWRITGLDPAGPCFSESLIQEQIRSGSAEYVEVYHCHAGGLGTTSVLADADFYVNTNGASQPHCHTPLIPVIFDSPETAICNNEACVHVWTASVANPDLFPAWKCDSYEDLKNGKCADNEVTIAGFWNPGNATGVFYFTTDGYDLYFGE